MAAIHASQLGSEPRRPLPVRAEPMPLFTSRYWSLHAGLRTRSLGSISSTWTVGTWLTMLRRALGRLGRALDLARPFELPDRNPDRMRRRSCSTSAWGSSSPSRCGSTGRRRSREYSSVHDDVDVLDDSDRLILEVNWSFSPGGHLGRPSVGSSLQMGSTASPCAKGDRPTPERTSRRNEDS